MQDTDTNETPTPEAAAAKDCRQEQQEDAVIENAADAASACCSDEVAAPAEGQPEPEEPKFLEHAQFVQNLDLAEYGRKRTPLRFHNSTHLHKWELLSAEPGIQIYSGFDNMPRVVPLSQSKSKKKKVPSAKKTVHVATAGMCKCLSLQVCVNA